METASGTFVMFVDFHTHLHMYAAGPCRDEALRSIICNTIFTVAASVDVPSWNDSLASAGLVNVSGKKLIVPTFGIHPSYCVGLPDNEAELTSYLEPFLAASPLIGEIGLDFWWEKKIPHYVQERVFRCILDHCNRTGKYCVIHTKGAEQRVADILSDFPCAKPVIHWYDGPPDVYRTFISRGYMQTFGCEVRYSGHVRRLLAMTPPELLLSETDNPTGEQWLGGTESSPALIKRVVCDMADVKQVSCTEMETIIMHNAGRTGIF
ncbi:MAG: TatD family hydrolase [Treponema sp.]